MENISPEFEKLQKICFAIAFKDKSEKDQLKIKGTGFFISEDGVALTAWHVIEKNRPK